MQAQACYGEAQVGCWVDNCRGIYMGEAIIEEAMGHGFDPADLDAHDGRWSEYEHYDELIDEAQEYMQKFAAPGFAFGYSDGFGDWGLWAIEEG